MSEIQTTDWDSTAASNTQTAPNGMPEGMAPSGVNDWGRETMAVIKRWFTRVMGLTDAGALVASAGTSTAITVAYDVAPASLYTGLECGFKVTTTCGADPTLNVNALGAKNIQKVVGNAYANLEAGDIVATQHVKLKYDGTLDKWVLLGNRPHPATFSAHKNGTDQTDITSSDTKVTFGTESWDVGSYFATSTWTPPAGRYRINATLRFSSSNGVDGEALTISIFKNAAALHRDVVRRSGTQTHSVRITAIVEADGNDTFELYASKSGAGDGTVEGGVTLAVFQGEAIA